MVKANDTVNARFDLRRYSVALALALLCLGFSALAPDAFASRANLVNLLQQITTLAIVATGATLIMVIGEFDLSFGYTASLAAVLTYVMFGHGYPIGMAILSGLAAGGLAGLANGVLVARFQAPSFVATLAIGTILSGFAYWLSGGASLFSGAPESFKALARGDVFGFPILALWMVGVLALAHILMAHTRLGRRLHAIGSNPQAARLVGLPILRDRITAFVIGGFLAALAGILLAARLGSVQHTMGEGFLLPAYAAAFLGATTSRTGTPNIGGAFLGVIIAGVVVNGLTIVGVEPFAQKMVTGAIIIAAVLMRQTPRKG
jgi:ribose transport system permease protein